MIMKQSLLVHCLFTASTFCWLPAACSQDSQPKFLKKTYTFKTVDKLDLKADVYRYEGSKDRPVIAWFHGGALIMGTRNGVPKKLLDLAKAKRYVVVSLDYRLAPQAKLKQIIEDLNDGLTWIRKSGPDLFEADGKKIVVCGASAGGYLALMSGVVADPKPTAIVSYWGFGDVDGEWTTKPSQAFLKGKKLTREEAVADMGDEVLTSTDKNSGRARSKFFVYLKQTGRWVNEVSGWDPIKDKQKLTPFCPVRNVTPEFPPTLFLHGTVDKDVAVEQSQNMANALKSKGVSHELIIVKDGGHGLWGGDPKKIDAAFNRSVEFIDEQLSK